MNRRSFLALLSAATLSVVIPEIWTPSKELLHLPAIEVVRKTTRVSAPADQILDIILCGKNSYSQVARFDVIRPDGEKILALALNTYGGFLRWCAAPGEELPAPLQFVYSGNMAINIVGKRGDQYSRSVLEPNEDGEPSDMLVTIPVEPEWASHVAFGPPRVPNVFSRAFRNPS